MNENERIPDALWGEWSGRSFDARRRQGELYGLPLHGIGEGIHLPSLAKALHDFLGDNAQSLAQIRRGREINLAFKELELRRLRLQVGETEGKYVSLETISPFVAEYMTELRGAAEDLEKEFGKDRLRHFYERIAAVIAKWEKRFGGLEGAAS